MRFDIPPENFLDNLSCNCIFTTNEGGLYLIVSILLYEKRPFLIARKIRSKAQIGIDFEPFIVKVDAVLKRVTAVAVESVLGYKFHILLDEEGQIEYIAKLPNMCELE